MASSTLQSRQSAETITATLRQRICLMDADRDNLLREGALAQEFGVSRTPIRQVLQRLAYEWLVETRSGVGTIVPRLEQARRGSDHAVAAALCRAAAEVAGDARMTGPAFQTIYGMHGMLKSQLVLGAEEVYALLAGTTETAALLIEDDILRDAFLASRWRVVRWRMRDYATDPAATQAALAERLQQIVDRAGGGRAADLLDALAGTEGQGRPSPL